MSRDGRTIGRPDELNLELYQRLAATGQLHVQRCRACGQWSHPPRYLCPNCFSRDYELAPVSGRGRVYSHTVSHVSAEPYWRDRVPYVTLVVELEQGVRLVASARDIGPDQVRIGMPVVVGVEPEGEEFAFFWAAPAPVSGAAEETSTS